MEETKKQIKEKRHINFGESVLLLIFYVVIFALGIGKYPTGVSIVLCTAITAIYAMFMLHYTWDELFGSVMAMFKTGLPSVFVLLMVGFISAAWLAAGTIPTLIVFGLKIVKPSIFLVTAFLLTSIGSITTGSSWTTVATFGVAMMGIAQGLGIPVGIAGGAIVSGCWVGDKWSPLSDTTNLAGAVTGQNAFDIFKYNLPTSGFGALLAAVTFAILGMRYSSGTMETESINALINNISDVYNISVITLLPVILIIVLSIMKKPPIPSLAISTAAAIVVAVLYQGSTLAENLSWIYNGIVCETGVENVDKLLTGGGILKVAPTTVIIFCALFLAGILNEVEVMPTVITKLGIFVKNRPTVIISTLVTAIFGTYLGGANYTGVIFGANMFEKSYKDLGLSKKDLARTVLEGAAHTGAMVPWSGGNALIVACLGVTSSQFMPTFFAHWFSIALTILFGFTGWFTTKEQNPVIEAEKYQI